MRRATKCSETDFGPAEPEGRSQTRPVKVLRTRHHTLLSNGRVGNNGFYQFHYYYIPRIGYGLRDRTDGLKNPTLAL